jgi:hypothetical protein
MQIRPKNSYGEYVVAFVYIVNGQRQSSETYHTDDEIDAMDTIVFEADRLVKSGWTIVQQSKSRIVLTHAA